MSCCRSARIIRTRAGRFCRVLVRPDGSAPPEDQPEEWTPMPAERSVVRVLRPEEYAFNTAEQLAA
jgi:hypothetical protein